ncbi:hypothetical protein SAMD00019534_103010 [Acytostelium subglobosum LB1]|uniref:hypothetical protein n=1 Tax=Acytostelium subglobosum LB1 TaxID=1410327 RepID=UPI0006447F35|nr:hypothetical protein SAMD00019534_103010 [Acytostelium subglobosum LB1]GAM27126.1 hypothetical protein SAMD00019534_103010 [Acytostelium subglobosum LB1]|eukprot:XP_012750006.1 hypothetical protein SAMD00019534_103010 [Acytostelium subglobosum LB1]
MIHDKREKFICLSCNTMVCSFCLAMSHSGHQFDSIDNIKQCIETKDNDALWCKARLDHLWDTLNDCATTYQWLEKKSGKISKQFEQLFKMLMAQEHKIKGPITLQMEQTRSKINDIINEMSDINSLINRSPPKQKDKIDDVVDISIVIESILERPSVEDFIDKSLAPALNEEEEDEEDDNHKLTDNELLLMIKNHAQHMQLTNGRCDVIVLVGNRRTDRVQS